MWQIVFYNLIFEGQVRVQRFVFQGKSELITTKLLKTVLRQFSLFVSAYYRGSE